MAVSDDFDAILAAQQKELAAAEALDSDFDYAFRLQMQDIAVNTCDSAAPPSLEPEALASSLLEADSSGLAAALLHEEVKRCEREHRDRELCLEEFKRTREDLDRRVYDRKFADEVNAIPDMDWQNYGDNYHKPYEAKTKAGECESSTSNRGLSECFRIYSKGLVSEEYVRGRRIDVVGIGAAICDFKDNVVLEIKKPWIGAGGVSELEAEFHAIVQGLDAALYLDLRRVTVFVNDACMHYITGQKSLGCSQVMSLVNQVIQLRKKFMQCELSLVVKPDFCNFAFKLARDAIVSQISWPEDTPTGKNWKETCGICFEDNDVSKMFSVDQCLHRYCCSCMKKHVEARLHNGATVKCPREGCMSEIAIDACEKFLEPKLFSLMSQQMKEASVPVHERVYCPYPRCSALMSRKEVLEYSNTSFIGAEQSGARKCVRCQQFFCISCQVPWHYHMNCDSYRAYNPNPASGDTKLKSLANEKRWRQCYKCKNMVELVFGCYHITCRCGYEFCYTCGARWINKKPTCTCPIWDERNIIDRPQGRRRFL